MNFTDVHRIFELKTLSNHISNIIIEEFKKINKKNVTRILVTDHNKFFVVEGTTNIDTPINISEVVNKELIRLSQLVSDVDNVQPINIIDLIEYNKIESQFLQYKNSYHKHITKAVTSRTKTPIISDDFYGLSDNTEKSYIMLSHYISHTLFESNMCKEVTISLSSQEELNKINVDNVDLLLSSSNMITNLEWAKSLVLDIFPFELESIIEDMDLYNYNYENILLNKGEKPFENRRKLKDIVLIECNPHY